MNEVAYYLPDIPNNRSVTPYNHALAIGRLSDRSAIITYPQNPPDEIADQYDHVVVLQPGGVIARAKEAAQYADEFLAKSRSNEGVFLTSFHYAPALSGCLSDHYWVLDVYDDPHQYRYHNTGLLHEAGARFLDIILRHADRGIHTVHPSTPHTFGKCRYFAMNGSNIEKIEANVGTQSNHHLQGVCAGVHGGIEILIQTLVNVDFPLQIDVYGEVSASERQLAKDSSVTDWLTIHGECDHPEVVDAVEDADIGFCLLPKKTDWYYAHPIKIGEYLAAGTIPIASAFPGIRQLTRDSGVLVEYDSDAVAEALTELHERPELRDRLKARCRQRAEAIDWRAEREWFAKQAILGDKCWNHSETS